MPGYLFWPLSLIFGVITVFLLMFGGSLWWLSTDSGRVYVERLVQSELSSAIGYQVRTEALRIEFPQTVHMSRLSLADEKGIWLEGEKGGVVPKAKTGPPSKATCQIRIHSIKSVAAVNEGDNAVVLTYALAQFRRELKERASPKGIFVCIKRTGKLIAIAPD